MTPKRKKTIKIRVSEEEHCALLDNCSSAQLAKWMREKCLDRQGRRSRRVTKIDPDLLRQLAAIGNNLNQISRAVNRERWVPINRMAIGVQLEAIEKQLAMIKSGE